MANAIFVGGQSEFVFTNYPSQLGRPTIDIGFKVHTIGFDKNLKFVENGLPEVPMLIDDNECDDAFALQYQQQTGVDLDTRVMQHNAALIKVFLQQEGDKNLLPTTG